MPKKKILHLITGLEIGGAETMLLKTLPHLQDDFDNCVCCIRGRGPMSERLTHAGITVYHLDLKSVFDIGIIFRFKEVIRKFQPDILVTYLIHADLFGRIFGRLFGIRRIICNQRGKLLQWEFLRIIDRATKFLVTKYIVQTESAQQELMTKLNLPSEKFEVIPNTIDLSEFDFNINREKKQTEIGIDPGDTVITCISNLRRGKGHEYLLEAFELLNQESRGDMLKLLIVGGGEKQLELIDRVRNYTSKENVLFLGHRTDTKEILKASDIFVLPTLGEGMSNAIMEAMASGLPVITTDIPENKILIREQENGFLVAPKNTVALKNSLSYLLNHPDLMTQLGHKAKQDIKERFSLEVVIPKLKEVFHN